MHGIGLAVVLIGIKTALKTDAILIIIISFAMGSFLGELLLIEDRLEQFGHWIGRQLSKDSAGISKGFVSASLLYCLCKADVPDGSVRSSVTCKVIRNDKGRLRVGGFDVRITLADELAQSLRLKRCRNLFEDFCVVTASVRQGIAVAVDVVDEQGVSLLED